MAFLSYDGRRGKLRLVDRDGNQVGEWDADNRVTNAVLQEYGISGLPNGDYLVRDKHYPSHDDEPSNYTSRGSVGPAGILKLRPFLVNGKLHKDVGVHAGRKGAPDQSPQRGTGVHHVTHLCVRTTDAAMSLIRATGLHDPITVLNVRGNDHVKGHPQPWIGFHR